MPDMVVLSLISYYIRHKLVTQSSKCDKRAYQWVAHGEGFLNPKIDRVFSGMDVSLELLKPTRTHRKEGNVRGQTCKEPEILTTAFRYEIKHLKHCSFSVTLIL